jgi:hypothetical protein
MSCSALYRHSKYQISNSIFLSLCHLAKEPIQVQGTVKLNKILSLQSFAQNPEKERL